MPVVLKSNLGALAASIPGLLDSGGEATANDIGDLAQQLAPEKTGDLKRSKKVAKRGPLWVVSFGDGLPDARAIYQEYGTSRSAAQPFLTPAVRAIDRTFRYKEALAAAVARNKV